MRNVFIECLESENLFCFLHVSANLDSERAAFFTDSAGYAFSRMMFEKFIVFPHRLRYFVVFADKSEIQELRDAGDVDLFRAGAAVRAVHAMSFPADFRE